MRRFAGTSARTRVRLAATAVLVGGALAAGGVGAAPAAAVPPAGPSGPVIYDFDGGWYIRTTPSGGNAQITFRYGRNTDLPVLGDWDANGSETVGVARFNSSGSWQWFLRNSNSAGGGNIAFSFGPITFGAVDRLTSIPIAGNFDPDDEEYEVGVALLSPGSNRWTWLIRRDLTPTSAVASFVFGTGTMFPVTGDWNGDNVDTAGLTEQPNRWLLTNRVLGGGNAEIVFSYGSSDPRLIELPVTGDWDGNGSDTPAVLRNIPASEAEGGFQQWLFRNSTTTGGANGSFVYGSDAFTVGLPIDFVPRLAIEIGAA